MAKESMKAREVKRQKLVAKYSKKRQELKEAGDYIGLQKLPKNYAGEDIAPFVLDKEVIEKPHAIKAMEIVKKHTNDK